MSKDGQKAAGEDRRKGERRQGGDRRNIPRVRTAEGTVKERREGDRRQRDEDG
jgi:hypothetical protein